MMTTKDILLKILEIIGYKEDKETFVNAFLVNIQLQALTALLGTVDPLRKKEIESVITSESPDKYQTLQKYFTEGQIEETLQKSAEDAVQEYIRTIDETLSDEQRKNLSDYASSLNS